MPTALILIDFINEIIHPDGKLAGKGYADFVEKHGVFNNLAFAIDKARENNMLVIHVKIGFSSDYSEQPKSSPLFGKAHAFEALKLNSWGTEFHESIDVKAGDVMITKHRVSAFYATPLDLILKNHKIDSIIVAGVATDLAVSSTARDAHDRDYQTTILADCCAAASDEEHKSALIALNKMASVKDCAEVF